MNTQCTKQTIDRSDVQGGKMKVMGFIASPRKEGNTAWIVNKILEGAKEAAGETQSWYFNDLDIKPCQSCYGCHNKCSGFFASNTGNHGRDYGSTDALLVKIETKV